MKIPGYTLLERCGRGAYGDVFLARDAAGRRVALKLLAQSARSDREMAGLRSYAKLPVCPHLIQIHHIGEIDGALYYTMEPADSLAEDHYLPATLGNILEAKGRFSAAKVLALAADLLEALQTLHAAKLVHRDIKPENILYIRGAVKLSDMGLLRSCSGTVSLGGTLGFIPPEKLTSSPAGQNAADDLYALGKVLYCAWTGFGPERFPEIPAFLAGEPEAARLNRIILTACAPDGANRFRSAGEFRTALEHGVSGGKRLGQLLRRVRPAALPAAAALAILFAVIRPPSCSRRAPAPVPEPPAAVPSAGKSAAESGTESSRLTLQVGVDADNAVRQTFLAPKNATPPPLPAIRSAGWEIMRGRFVNPQIWRDVELLNTTVSAETLHFLPRASGALRLDRALPARYRILFSLTLPQLAGTLRFRVESPDGKEALVWSVAGKDGHLTGTPIRYYAEGREQVLAQSAHPVPMSRERNRLEILRSDDRFAIILGDRIIHAAGTVFAGGYFTVEADCGDRNDARLTHFQLFQLP